MKLKTPINMCETLTAHNRTMSFLRISLTIEMSTRRSIDGQRPDCKSSQGAGPAKLPFLPYPLADPEGFRHVYCNSGNLKDFLCRNRRGPTRLNGLEKRLNTGSVPLVLTPCPEGSKAWTAKAAQRSKVIQLKNPTKGKHLNTLLRKGAMSIGAVLNGGDRAVRKFQRNVCSIQTGRCAAAAPHCTSPARHDPRTYQEARQINEVTSLAKNSPSTNQRVLGPMICRNCTRIHQQRQRFRAFSLLEYLAHALHMRRESSVEPDKNDR